MGSFLRNLGEYAFTKKWWIISGWLVILVILGFIASQQYQSPTNSVSIPGTEAQKTLDRFAELFPDAGKGSARIVLETSSGTIKDQGPVIDKMVKQLQAVEGVSQVVSPFIDTTAISQDGTISYISIQLTEEADAVAPETRAAITQIAESSRSDTLTVEYGGDVIDNVPGEILGVGEVAGVLLALLVLVVTLGSLVAAGLPIMIAIITISASMAGLFGLSQIIDITATTPVLAVMLGLAVGIDYSLFIVNKYRHYLLQGYDARTAAGRAIATAGNAVLFAALTVVIALSALAIVQIPFMTTMGLAAAATVAVAALVSVTLLPALMGVVGSRIFRGKTRKAISAAHKRGPKDSHRVNHKTIWFRWGELITKHPIVSLIGAVVVIIMMALPVQSLSLGLPTDEYAAKDTTQRKAYDMLQRGFGVGFNAPLLVVVEDFKPVSDEDRQTVRSELEAVFRQRMSDEAARQAAVFETRASQITNPDEAAQLQNDILSAQLSAATQQAQARSQLELQINQYTQRYQLAQIANRIEKLDGVTTAIPVLVTDDMTKGAIQVIPSASPSDPATIELIEYLRQPVNMAFLAADRGVLFGVTGSTALQNDINNKLATALPEYLLVVVGLSLLLLVVVFRSILVPLKATLGFLLSVLAMFGAIVVVFQWGWFGIADAPGPIVSFIPIIAIGVLFGLAMDYEFFLVSSMHEEYARTKDADRAVVDGFGIGSRVVVAAGVIMVAVFAGFVTNHDVTIQAIGFGLAIGIFVDAFLVRLTIVPAVMKLLGKRAWWIPKWLDRILPHVSIEGELPARLK